jgi:xanthine dehydrogenase accessory factor
VSHTGKVAGSISGGCIEGAVVEEALIAIATGNPKLLNYGAADELDLAVGLTCGGSIQVFVEPCSKYNIAIEDIFEAIRQASVKSVALCTVVEGSTVGAKMVVAENEPSIGSLGNLDLDRLVTREACNFIDRGIKGLYYCEIDGESQPAVFIRPLHKG